MRRAIWVVCSVVLGAGAVAAAMGEREEGTAYAMGAGLAGLLFPLTVAVLVRLVYVRFLAKRGRIVSPWILMIASVFALLATAGRVDKERQELRADVDEALFEAHKCRRSAGRPFWPLPAGLRYRRLDTSRREALAKSFPSWASPLIDGRLVAQDGANVGVVLAMAAVDGQAEVREGFEDGLREKGVALTSIKFGQRDAVYGRAPVGVVAGGTTACDFITIAAVDLPTLRLIGERVIGEAD